MYMHMQAAWPWPFLATLIHLALGFIGWLQYHLRAQQRHRAFKTENTDIVGKKWHAIESKLGPPLANKWRIDETMLNVKVGRAFRRENTSWVDPQATKGTLALAPGDDGLLHLTWKNRETDNVEDVNWFRHLYWMNINTHSLPGPDHHTRRRVISACGRSILGTRFRPQIW
jgi:hypothetical protein